MGASDSTNFEVGTVIDGRYRVIDVIGEGGMGSVYLAEHTMIRRHVAVKVMHAELTGELEVIERFMNEARAAGTLGHPNIVASTDMGFIDASKRRPYIVFEHLVGTILTDEIYRLGGLAQNRAIRIAEQIASALRAAHASRIVHRDIKSDNVFLVETDGDAETDDFVKVLDFGISKFAALGRATKRGLVLGTPEYMAPEQIHSPDTVDQRADIYGLGVILYEMLEGRRPFRADEDPQELLHAIVHTEPPPFIKNHPPRLADLVFRMLAKDPDHRFQSIQDVEDNLAPFLRGRRSGRVSAPRMAVLTPRPFVAPDVGRPTPRPSQPPPTTTSRDSVGPTPVPTIHPIAPRGIPGSAIGVTIGALAIAGGAVWFALRQANEPKPEKTVPVATTPAPAAATSTAPSKVRVAFNADAPEARITFRRRVSTLGEIEIVPSDIVELVEVSAPGRKTMRYWLTIDRPTQLEARLPPGEGLAEASELETLIALGEAPDTAAPATAVVAAKAVNAAQAKRDHARKIGRGSPGAAASDVRPSLKEPKAGVLATAADLETTTKTKVAAKPVEVKADTKANKPAEVRADTKANKPTEVRADTKANKPTEVKAGSKQAAANATKPGVGSGSNAKTDPKAMTTTPPPPVETTPPPVETKPPPPPVVAAAPASRTVPMSVFEQNRTTGQRKIVPDDNTKVAISQRGDNMVVSSFKVCLAASGSITEVAPLKASAYPTYDKSILAAIRSWKFKPIVVDGSAGPACTVYAFQYTQK